MIRGFSSEAPPTRLLRPELHVWLGGEANSAQKAGWVLGAERQPGVIIEDATAVGAHLRPSVGGSESDFVHDPDCRRIAHELFTRAAARAVVAPLSWALGGIDRGRHRGLVHGRRRRAWHSVREALSADCRSTPG